MAERLQKYLARCGIASRRSAESLIQAGRVQVNGQTVTLLGSTVEPGRDEVKVDGRVVYPEDKPVYVLLNKPKGYVTTVKDDRGRPTVLALVKDIPQRIYPVGRLDLDTEGLLLLTNDGYLAYKLTHPKHQIPKTYRALVQGHPSRMALTRLRQGVVLDGRKTAPAQVRVLGHRGADTWVELVIHEGRNRQVRRMCEEVGHPVLALKRVRLAFLELGKLKVGEYRLLTEREVKQLYRLISSPGA